MARTFKIVIVLLASLQLAHLASLSTNRDDNKIVHGHLSRIVKTHSKLHPQNKIHQAKHIKRKDASEKNNLSFDDGSDARLRSKRQIEQDAESDVEIISNDPKIFSHGMSMNMTTMNDVVHEHHHEAEESDIWNDDIDSTDKNSLVELEDKHGEKDEASNEEQDTDALPSDIQTSSFKSPSQDISTVNHATVPEVMASAEDNLGGSSSHIEQNHEEVHIVPTVLYDDADVKYVPGDDAPKKENAFEVEEKDNGDNDNTEASPAEDHAEAIVVDKEGTGTTNKEGHLNEAATLNQDSFPSDNKLSDGKDELADMLSTEVDVDDNKGIHSDNIDAEDVDTFLPLDNLNDKTYRGKLTHYDSDSEEGSGDMDSDVTDSLETKPENGIGKTFSSENNKSVEISVKEDDITFNIDSTTEKNNGEGGNEMKKEKEDMPVHDSNEISSKADEPSKHLGSSDDDKEDDAEGETPIPDPTNISWKGDDSPNTYSLSEEETDEESDEVPIPDPTEEPSKVDDQSQTYDPTKVIDPLGIDKLDQFAEAIAKGVGFVDNSEEIADGKDLEGSGQSIEYTGPDNADNSLENGMFKPTNIRLSNEEIKRDDFKETTTEKGEEGITEIPAIVRNIGKLNAVRGGPSDPTARQDEGSVTNMPDIAAKEKEEITIPPGMEEKPSEGPLPVPDVYGDVNQRQVALPSPASINEMGVKKGEKVAETETDPETETSTSSTGSFIVLGAIMATIVVLLGYSVIKTRRQKQQALSKPKEDEPGTELKEVEKLLPGMNGQGPTNRLNAEEDALLSPIDYRENSYPMYRNGVSEENGIVSGQPANVLQIENPDDLKEVKVKKPESSPQANGIETPASPLNLDEVFPVVAINTYNTSNAPITNGLGVKNPPGNSDHDRQPDNPERDDSGSRVHGTGTQPERVTAKTFTNNDSIPKTPIVIEKRGNDVKI